MESERPSASPLASPLGLESSSPIGFPAVASETLSAGTSGSGHRGAAAGRQALPQSLEQVDVGFPGLRHLQNTIS